MPIISVSCNENNRKRKVWYMVCCNKMKQRWCAIKTVTDADN